MLPANAQLPNEGGVSGRHMLLVHVLIGVLFGILLLHPVTKAIYPVAWHGQSALQRLGLAFSPRMLPMTAAFALVGAAVGLVFGLYHRRLARQSRAIGFLEAELARTVSSLVSAGENAHVEFKASARWDLQHNCVRRDLEESIVHTVAGFLNGDGGSLLIGVADDGTISGIEQDYRTLHRPGRDGFERFITDLVRTRLGGDLCPLVHATFHRVAGRDVCRVIIEPAARPVYMVDRGKHQFVLRTGNSTRELDVQEATEYVLRRFPNLSRSRRSQRGATPDPRAAEMIGLGVGTMPATARAWDRATTNEMQANTGG